MHKARFHHPSTIGERKARETMKFTRTLCINIDNNTVVIDNETVNSSPLPYINKHVTVQGIKFDIESFHVSTALSRSGYEYETIVIYVTGGKGAEGAGT